MPLMLLIEDEGLFQDHTGRSFDNYGEVKEISKWQYDELMELVNYKELAVRLTQGMAHRASHRRYPICFDVKCYPDTDIESVIKFAKEFNAAELDPNKLAEVNWHPDLEEAYADARLIVMDGDVFNHITQQSFYDLGYDVKFDADYTFIGRSSGWLAVESFDGVILEPHLTDMEQPNEWWHRLCAAIRYWQQEFTRTNARYAVMHQLVRQFEDALEGT